MHLRQKKFLELRLKDPSSLYDVGEIRAHLAPKRTALLTEQMKMKGYLKSRLDKDDKIGTENQVQN